MEPLVRARRHRGAVRIEDDDAAARRQRSHSLVEEARRPCEMVEDVDENEVGERTVRVRKCLCVDDFRRPGRRLDIRALDPGTGVLQGADPRTELDRAARGG